MKLSCLLVIVCAAAASVNAGALSRGTAISGRELVAIEDHPHHAIILWYYNYICNAVILSNKFVMTAAHCTWTDGQTYLQIRAHSDRMDADGRVYGIMRQHFHPRYDPHAAAPQSHDIALLELRHTLYLDQAAQPARLPPSADFRLDDGTVARYTTWMPVDAPHAAAAAAAAAEEVEEAYLFVRETRVAVATRCAAAKLPDDAICTEVGDASGAVMPPRAADEGTALTVGTPGTADQLVVGVYVHGGSPGAGPALFASVAAARDFIREVAGV